MIPRFPLQMSTPSVATDLTVSAQNALAPLFGITPDLQLPPFWAYPAAIMLLILVGVTSLGLAKLYVKVKVMLGLD